MPSFVNVVDIASMLEPNARRPATPAGWHPSPIWTLLAYVVPAAPVQPITIAPAAKLADAAP